MALTRNKRIMSVIVGLAILGTVGAPFAAYAAVSDAKNTIITATVEPTITVASTGAVGLSLTPGASAVLTSAYDTVTVNTNNTAGYTLTLADTDATLALTNGSYTIAAHDGTQAAPTALANNTWGWAIPGTPFDSTYAEETNATSSSTKWAGISQTPATLKSTSSTATDDITTVWYAAKVTSAQPTGAYTDTVVYTATTK